MVRVRESELGPHERLLTVREVSQQLQVCTAIVYRLCERGELPSVRIGGAIRFRSLDVAHYLSGVRAQPDVDGNAA